MPDPEICVALAGLGTVGSAAARLLRQEQARYRDEFNLSVRLVAILDRSYTRKDLSWVRAADVRMTDSVQEFLDIPSDIVVELIGGEDPADQIIRRSLQRGKAVVTANKLLMARNGEHYLKIAAEHHAYLGFEACVAGGVPIIRVLQRSLFADRVVRLRGILNGTCNFILSEMSETGHSFEEILKQAQRLGYAEADPSLDVSGQDTRDKLAILSALAFGNWVVPEEIPTQGITEISPVDFLYARKLTTTIRLLGVGEEDGEGLSLRVSPFLVRERLPLSKISGALNAVEVAGAMVGSTVLSGQGAGGNPTAVSVVADVLNAALGAGKKAGSGPAVSPGPQGAASKKRSTESHPAYPFYIRFFVKDRPGIIGALSGILAREGINIDSVVQERGHDTSNLPFIITVEATVFSTIQRAVAEMRKLEFNNLPPLALPILEQ